MGVGPGDPELITVKAIRVLRTADLVLVPVLGRPGEEDRAETGRAEATVRAHVDDAVIRRVAFALNDTGGVTPDRASAWDAAADAVTGAFAAGAGTVAFATLGDPALYSTFSYLAQSVTARDPGSRWRPCQASPLCRTWPRGAAPCWPRAPSRWCCCR